MYRILLSKDQDTMTSSVYINTPDNNTETGDIINRNNL